MDITTALTNSNNGVHWIVVRVYDPNESAHIVLGKQRLSPKESIFYKGVQGIWGSVWLEPVSTCTMQIASTVSLLHCKLIGVAVNTIVMKTLSLAFDM